VPLPGWFKKWNLRWVTAGKRHSRPDLPERLAVSEELARVARARAAQAHRHREANNMGALVNSALGMSRGERGTR
jgi:hypothetical protein